MFKVILAGLLLCLTPNVYAQEKQAPASELAAESFMSLSDAQKQSTLLDLISANKSVQAKSLLEHWERTAPEENGPNEFLKSYIVDLIKAQEQSQTPEQTAESFMSLSDAQKQSTILELISVKKTDQAKSFLKQWERTSPKGKGPNQFIKSYILDLIKAQEDKQE